MSEESKQKGHSDKQVIFFMIVLCFSCGLLLSLVAYTLAPAQKIAKEFDQSKQMLIAAKVLSHGGYFEIPGEDGTFVPARFDSEKKILVKTDQPEKASDDDIKEIASLRIRPLLTNKKGEVFTIEEKGINLPDYLETNKKNGYAYLPLKLFYVVLKNNAEDQAMSAEALTKDLEKASSIVIPVSGFGLWAAIYGYLAISPNGDEVIGTTWYGQEETPGLGANIAEPSWQSQFYGKLVFQETAEGKTDFKTADMGITVVKGKVQDVLGTVPKSKSAVDGISGATLTGDGVSAAYHDSLTPYRALLIKLHNASQKESDDAKKAAA